MTLRTKNYGGKELSAYTNHGQANNAFNNLIKKISPNKADPSYKQKIKPFLLEISKQTKYANQIEATKNLVNEFMTSNMDKNAFKDGWRAIQPGTDEHLSTESVFTMLATFREKQKSTPGKKKQDMEVIKDIFAVISVFRLPTEETGHDALGHSLAHPRGTKQSLHESTSRSPNHGNFDMIRKTYAVSNGEKDQRKGSGDGTGSLLSVLNDAVKITMHNVANPYSTDVHISPGTTEKQMETAFNNREETKRLSNLLNGINDTREQSMDNAQYKGFASISDRTFEESPGALSDRNVRSLSPPRLRPSASLDPSSGGSSSTPLTRQKRSRSLTNRSTSASASMSKLAKTT